MLDPKAPGPPADPAGDSVGGSAAVARHPVPLSLTALGWSGHWADLFAPHAALGRLPGRVVAATRDSLRVATGAAEEEALVPGRLLHLAASPAVLPCVGDWVALRRPDGGQPLAVEAVLARRGALIRRAAGRRTEPQALVANLDLALLVSGLDGDFSPRRLERWLSLALAADAAPVVVLTKLDLCPDPAPQRAAATAVVGEAPVHLVDALGGAGVEALRVHLRPAATVGLLGSSGVGKSTLLNQLVGRTVAATAALADDGRGRHTTTARQLLLLPGGALLVDTPGLREVGVWLGEQPLAAVFPEIAALAARCRFRDCGHGGEPGCAVRSAVERGELAVERLASLRQLSAERAAVQRRTDERATREERRRGRAMRRAQKKHRPRQL